MGGSRADLTSSRPANFARVIALLLPGRHCQRIHPPYLLQNKNGNPGQLSSSSRYFLAALTNGPGISTLFSPG